MQRIIYFYKLFAMISAMDVSVYNAHDFFSKGLTDTMTGPKPVSCLSFGYYLNDSLYMRIYITNKPPGVRAINVTYQLGLETVEKSKDVETLTGEEYYWVRRVLNYPEVKVSLKLYTSHTLCSSLIVAEGRDVSTSRNTRTEKTYSYNDICLRHIPCVLLVDLKHKCKDLKHTNNTVVIFGSLSSITLILIAIIAIGKRCWIKYSPVPTNHHSEPFYLNMLFRRECDQEIAEIEQHHYEEITPQVTGGG